MVARDQFVWLIGGLGLGLAIVTGALLGFGRGGRGWLALAVPLSAAVVAVLLYELLQALVRRRHWTALLPRLALLGLNGVFFIAELLALIAAQSRG